jgi:branched-chain amino acid transport system ATP-binding protein
MRLGEAGLLRSARNDGLASLDYSFMDPLNCPAQTHRCRLSLFEVDRVSKSFGALRAVDAVSFAVESGEIFGIAGPNGSGKSTLFNIITGLPSGPDTGRVIFGGKEIQGRSAHQIARMGLTRSFQRETSFDGLSVWENVLMSATYGRSGSASHADIAEALELVGFERRDFGRPAQDLSVYERKCLMLATAVAMSPRILLLDEPASGLTKPEIAQAIGLVRKIAARGLTILLIEHVLTFLITLSQRLLVLNQGQILALGEPRAVIKEPRVIEAYLGSRRHET